MLIYWYKLVNVLHFWRARLVENVLFLVNITAVRLYLAALLASNIANWFLAYYVNKNVSQTLVVLHYNVNLGVNLIGNVFSIYAMPALGLAFILINFFLLANVYAKKVFLIHLLLGAALLANIFLIASTVSIYLINFR
ncbi:MAG: hypothetical protein PHS62_01180 [Patescibacteria group bacterium]|nr:hypothetical protein [Patescibacteria group bacterium]